MKIFKAFTLAEVLITVAIIGIIAMFTIPTLVSNYQRKVLVSQLQKGYALAKKGIEDSISLEKALSFRDTKLYKHCFVGNSSSLCQQALNKYFRTSKTEYAEYGDVKKSFYELNCDSHYGEYSNCYQSEATRNEYGTGNTVVLSDGITFYMRYDNGPLLLTIDTNGDTEPNTFGRDIFVFMVDSRDGKLTPAGPRPNAQDIMDAGWKMEY